MTTGAVSLVETALRAGVEVCFANPGTTEVPIVAALDQVPGMRAVLCLFEGVCTGAADGPKVHMLADPDAGVDAALALESLAQECYPSTVDMLPDFSYIE